MNTTQMIQRSDRLGRLLITMEPGAKFRFTFLYSLGGQYRSVTAELPRPSTADLLQAITEALLQGIPVDDNEPVAADTKAYGVWVAELIKERDELKDHAAELLDQVQCLQWDLSALQAQHDLCPQPMTGKVS
ncbi:hypothetical protein D7D52_34120 [Nocardia yunnanensis]|uniref:Uncharacterized protein n=1 Tax=Nocardia yunnanensis TaxID=2382165 RepID=A0A386ZLJ2_9NOCA|nr:hypothetical protein [Nocardia yunnanensis]AYF78024.1 hypothetical protein D7D52_34120 [Nocardia yunnanensis]